jgi:hypothetical protein
MFMGDIDVVNSFDGPCGGTSFCQGPIPVKPPWSGSCSGLVFYSGGITKCGSGSDCSTTGTQACNQSVQAGPLQVMGGTCGTPPMPTKVLPAVTWTNNAEACGTPMPGTGCNAGHTCLATPQGAFVKGVCVMQAGEVATCPAGFTDRHVVYDPTKTTDGRACGACTCGAMMGGTCTATINVYSSNTGSCAGPIATLSPTTQAGDCKNVTGNPAIGDVHATFSMVTGGTCAAGGGQPSGSATAGGATTFCCIPAM